MNKIESLFVKLKERPDATLYPGADPVCFRQLEDAAGIRLPQSHQQFLQLTNGFELHDGYGRFFGIGAQAAIDQMWWNHPECWKFAWKGSADGFWCFGEDAWGGQYAYALHELRASDDPAVYVLSGPDPDPFVVSNSFTEDLEVMVLHPQIDGFDLLCKRKYPRLQPSEQLIRVIPPGWVPPGQQWDPELVIVMNARIAMISRADVHYQTRGCPEGYTWDRMELVTDDKGRPRVKMIWCVDPDYHSNAGGTCSD